ncbi:extracellular solute-binding protein family 1 [Ancylobacter novellus DSM 506]|uniref:Extracellular solute-binding protein family 1 n=1 Tax=Ancylobacter novellus (strain ATCC 8093 / DSM 506 / JCM 20403 / CCM 1077 / IAM 12100 / NBRC 12443 / NCIMB 10456) TaxID=639283 RepID=D7AA00_ANCN5|nr:ABC transporter substrate-binding protein [Ancylobacter novellus]ADH90787.1 extracellular solute-binding protein family 1 [Ancylobacter novellus DSM 506]
MKPAIACLLSGTIAVSLAAVPAVAQDSIVVAAFGGKHGQTLQKCVVQPFMDKTGTKVTVDQGVSSVTVAKLKQQKASPSLDVVWLDGEVSQAAESEGVFAEIDPAQVPNIANIIPEAVYKNKDGKITGLGDYYYSVGIVYNMDEIKQAPTSWFDLWKPEFAGDITWPSMSDGSGAPALVFLSELLGGSVTNLKPGADKLKTLEVAAFYDSGGNASNILSRKEATIGVLDSGAVWSLADANPFKVGFVIPKEGGMASGTRLHLIKPSKAAYDFINFALTPEAQTCFVENYFYGPSVKGLKLSEKATARLPWGPNGSIKDLHFSDTVAIDANRQQIMETWNRDVLGRR